MTTLQDVVDIGRSDQYLAVVSTLRADATIQSSVVNAGVLAHPITGSDVIGFVTYGRAKLSNLRSRPQVSITFRSGWQWATAEGRAELVLLPLGWHRRLLNLPCLAVPTPCGLHGAGSLKSLADRETE